MIHLSGHMLRILLRPSVVTAVLPSALTLAHLCHSIYRCLDRFSPFTMMLTSVRSIVDDKSVVFDCCLCRLFTLTFVFVFAMRQNLCRMRIQHP